MAAYHLAFGPKGSLFLTGPTTSSYDPIFQITVNGEVSEFFRGLGRPQGLALDQEENLYVAASLGGRRGIIRISPEGTAELVVSGTGLVGLAFQKSQGMILATTSAVYRLSLKVSGRPLLG